MAKLTRNTATELLQYILYPLNYVFVKLLSFYVVANYIVHPSDLLSLTVYGAAVLEHCLVEEGFPENVKIGKGFNLEEGKSACKAKIYNCCNVLLSVLCHSTVCLISSQLFFMKQ